MSRGGPKRGRPAIIKGTPAQKAARIIERDLATLTGPELGQKYGKSDSAAAQAFQSIVGQPVSAISGSHNPFWHYTLAVWFDNPEGRALLGPAHRQMADLYLEFALGRLDSFDAVHIELPRRALKSTFLMAFADWVGKRHKLVDGLDISVLYSHNSEREASRRVGVIKAKNRGHSYISANFAEFQIPDGEWGTQSEWNWPCRSTVSSTAEASITAMSAAAKKAGRGYNYKLLDDWEDEDSRTSDIIRADLSFQYDQLRALKAVPWSRELSAGTPYHIHGLYEPMRTATHSDGTPRYKTLIIPALTDKDAPNFGQIPALTVEGLAKERANEMQRTGSDTFWYLQYQLDPRLTGQQSMEWEWFRPLKQSEYVSKWLRLAHFSAIFCDPAWKGTENQGKGCDSAIGAIDIYHRGFTYDFVLKELVVSNEMTADEGCREIARLMKKWGTPYFYVEQPAGRDIDPFVKQAARSIFLSAIPIEIGKWSKKRKDDRIASLAGHARTGNVFYLDNIEHLAQLKVQVADHPFATKKDILDMWANCFSEEILSKWVPVAVDEVWPRHILESLEADERPTGYVTRYTHVPAIN